MAHSTEISTACLDVTLQVNKVWAKRVAPSSLHAAKQAVVSSGPSSSSPSSSSPLSSSPLSSGPLFSGASHPGRDETLLLCSDIITVDDELRASPQFDITSYVMEHAIAHTLRFCRNSGKTIRAFRSVEVLRLMQPGLPVSFLFLFEAIMGAARSA